MAGTQRRRRTAGPTTPVYVPWGMVAGKWMIGGVSFGETTATALGIPLRDRGRGQGISRARYYPDVQAGEGQAARRARHAAADRRADGRRGGHQGAGRLPGHGRARSASRCEDLATMENVYSPPIGALNEPIALAAQNGAAPGGEQLRCPLSRWLRGPTRSATCCGTRSARVAGSATESRPPAAPASARRDLLAPRLRPGLPPACRGGCAAGDARDARQPPPPVDAATSTGATRRSDPAGQRSSSPHQPRRSHQMPKTVADPARPPKGERSTTPRRRSSRTSRPSPARRPSCSSTPCRSRARWPW